MQDLLLETRHTGKVLIVRTFGHALRHVEIRNAVEDTQGNVDRLGVLFHPPASTTRQILPKNAIFAVKEPYYTYETEGITIIRVFHPSDLVALAPGNCHIPIEFALADADLNMTAMEHKMRGNAAYTAERYSLAIEHYTAGIRMSDDAVLRSVLLRNRALVNHLLHGFDGAAKDARAALLLATDMPDEVARAQANMKSHLRAGRAQYALADYAQAALEYAEAQKLAPDDADVSREMTRTKQRLAEMRSNECDVAMLFKKLRPGRLRLDHASFMNNVELRDAGKRGRGLFATKLIKAGSLVFAEKAFLVTFASQDTAAHELVSNAATSDWQPTACLVHHCVAVQKLSHNPSLARKFLELNDVAYYPKCACDKVDGMAVIDAFEVQAVLDQRTTDCPEGRSLCHGDQEKAMDSKGLWIMGSRVNHACNGNASPAFCGDFMLLYATRDILCSEEITTSYTADVVDQPTKVREDLEWQYGFRCDCALCSAETAVDGTLLSTRSEQLMELGHAFLAHLSKIDQVKPAIARQIRRDYARIVKTYPPEIYARLPRLHLVSCSKIICLMAFRSGTMIEELEAARDVLRNFGYNIKVDNEVTVDRQQAIPHWLTVKHAMHAAWLYTFMGKPMYGKPFEDLAKLDYRILYGDLSGFSEHFHKGLASWMLTRGIDLRSFVHLNQQA